MLRTGHIYYVEIVGLAWDDVGFRDTTPNNGESNMSNMENEMVMVYRDQDLGALGLV